MMPIATQIGDESCSIWMRPASAEMPRKLLGDVRDDRAELPDALVGQTGRWAGNRDRTQRLGVLVVHRCADAARRTRVLLVVERIAALADDSQRRPHCL